MGRAHGELYVDVQCFHVRIYLGLSRVWDGGFLPLYEINGSVSLLGWGGEGVEGRLKKERREGGRKRPYSCKQRPRCRSSPEGPMDHNLHVSSGWLGRHCNHLSHPRIYHERTSGHLYTHSNASCSLILPFAAQPCYERSSQDSLCLVCVPIAHTELHGFESPMHHA